MKMMDSARDALASAKETTAAAATSVSGAMRVAIISCVLSVLAILISLVSVVTRVTARADVSRETLARG